MGFPSLIYTNGWVMALWICSYMVVPLTTMALLGKRINQVARIAGSVTVPDVLRDRFQSPALGIVSTVLILLFLTFNLVAQFKGGALVMKEALRLPPADTQFQDARSEGHHLVLRFRSGEGREETQKTALPSPDALYLPEQTAVRGEGLEKRVEVHFRVRGEGE